MFLDIILLDWCSTFCKWWWLLLPLLMLLSWLLGWLFWSGYKSRYLAEIKSLEDDLAKCKAKGAELEKDLSTSRYDLEKLEGDYRKLRGSNADLDMKVRALNEQNQNLLAAANTEVNNTGSADYEARIASLEADLKACEDAKIALTASAGTGGALGIAGGMGGDDDDGDVLSGYAAAFASDNLQIIEGVGPKIEGLLKAGGYNTWSEVGNAELTGLQKVLDDAGPRYRIHNPSSWSEQARLAASGQWDDLIRLQKDLDSGGEAANGDTPSKVEKLYAKHLGFAAFKKDDLKIVEGIGPKIAGLLNDAGITTWEGLANTAVERIKEILTNAGDRYRLADPTTWPRQARMAADAKWTALKKYQDELDGGRA